MRKIVVKKLKKIAKLWFRLKGEQRKIVQGNFNDQKLLIATGFDKSGTTLLSAVLNSHPHITCNSSGQFFNFYLEDQKFLNEPGGYRRIQEGIKNNQWFRMSGKSYLNDEFISEYVKFFIADSIRKFGNDNDVYFADKSVVQDVYVIKKLYPKSNIVAMVRDGRDVAVSFAFHFYRKGRDNKFENIEKYKIDKNYLKEVATAWAFYNENLIQAKQDIKGLQVIYYEDMNIEKSREISKVFDFLNIQNTDKIINDALKYTAFDRMSGGRAEGQEDINSFQRKGIVGDWKNYFDKEDQLIFESIAGDQLAKLGYEVS